MATNNPGAVFLHIGNGKSLRTRDIVGIFDLDSATVSDTTKTMLKEAENTHRLFYTDEDLPRSFLLVAGKHRKGETFYLSRITPQGLALRAESLPGEEIELPEDNATISPLPAE